MDVRYRKPRFATQPGVANREKAFRAHLEQLEDRRLLAIVTYVNDNWVNTDSPGAAPIPLVTHVSNANDPVNPGGITGIYGSTAFGKVSGLSVAGYGLIHDAIQATDAGGTLNLLPGTYTESDIVIDRPLSLVGAGQSGAAQSLIVPETVSSHADLSNFGVGTHSGILIYAAGVRVQTLHLDGSGNGSLGGGGLHYHQGITTLYDLQNGGGYSSLRNGVLTPVVLGTSWRAPNETVLDLNIESVTVDNVFWHGITISAVADKAFDPGPGAAALEVVNSTVNNVGDVKDLNRIGILLQNLNDTSVNSTGNAVRNHITGAGVGIRTAAFGASPSFEDFNAAHNGAILAYNTVTSAVLRGYDIDFGFRQGNFGNVATFSAGNNATGVYLNHSRPYLMGLQVDGAKIGLHVQNSPLSSGVLPITGFDAELTGPGSGVAGSVGVLVENTVAQPNSASMTIGGSTAISGYEVGIKIDQLTSPADSQPNTVYLDRPIVTGNGTGISVGNGGLLQGRAETTQNLVVTGTGKVEPLFANNPDDPYYYNSPGNATSPVITPPKADEQYTGNVSFSAGSTLSTLITGESAANAMLFNFNQPQSYPFAAPPSTPVNGETTTPNGALLTWYGNVTQNGNGLLSVGGGATNGYGLDVVFGTNSHLHPDQANHPGISILDPTDISQYTQLKVAVKLAATNEASVIGFGLLDLRGNVNQWTIPTSTLNTSTFTTVTINLLAPSSILFGEDHHLDLTQIVGFVFGGDQGNVNGLHSTPIGFSVDQIELASIRNSRLRVAGTVNLGGATLEGSLRSGFVPTLGQQFTLIDNDGADPVVGTFAGVPQNAFVTISGLSFRVNYSGGTGNDVILSREISESFPPTISISNVTVAEGNAGTTPLVFTVSLSNSALSNVTAQYATADGTATTANNDYTATSGTLTFTPGQTTQLITVLVKGDTTPEPNETFSVLLSNPSENATILGGTGVGTILNDEPFEPTTIGNRRVFYNQSKFDGNTSGVSTSDDLAIATDKVALLPGAGQATFANMTSYTRGLNGIMVDIQGTHGTLTASDFSFKVGANNTPSLWASTLEVPSITVRTGAGTGGSDRVEIIFTAANAPKNQWLQVIVKGNDTRGGFNSNTGLAASDIFFFGNRVGDDGTGTVAQALTSFVDENGAKTHSGAATITNAWDFDRSGLVSSTDQLAARFNTGNLLKINIANPPAAPEAAPTIALAGAAATESGVASALAAKSLATVENLPTWITQRLSSPDLNFNPTARPGSVLTNLADTNLVDVGGPRSRALLKAVDKLVAAHADKRGGSDSLLDDLWAELG